MAALIKDILEDDRIPTYLSKAKTKAKDLGAELLSDQFNAS